MRKLRLYTLGVLALGLPGPGLAADDPKLETLRQEIERLRADYETRLEALEKQLQALSEARPESADQEPSEADLRATAASAPGQPVGANVFNPAISVILDGQYTHFDKNPDDYAMPGFQLNGEAGPGEEGFSVEHTELHLSANVDDYFYGNLAVALDTHDGETEIELEEAFVETLALGRGLTVKGGRFYSGIGYLNQQHAHQWAFADTALVYRAFFGNQLNDDGVQMSWVAPTDLYLRLGAELLRGGDFPAAGAANDGVGAYTLFAGLGGDLGTGHSWEARLSYWSADVDGRDSDEPHGDGRSDSVSFEGDSRIVGAGLVWKWAPDGNAYRRNLVLQGEYFYRDEDGTVTVEDGAERSSYDGNQKGWYAQVVYQFMPRWRLGLRYDWMDADNGGSDPGVLAEAGLLSGGHNPQRYSVMTDFSHSEFSRLRMQYNRDESRRDTDHQWYLQYVMSLGAHGAHKF